MMDVLIVGLMKVIIMIALNVAVIYILNYSSMHLNQTIVKHDCR